MKIKLTQPGFENYNGQMGILQFVDGMSTTDVPFRDAARMSAVMNCEFEDGTSCNPAQRLLDTAGQGAPVGRDAAIVDGPAPPAASDEPVTSEPAPVLAEDSNVYSLEELEAIADKDGINGLREIAGPLGIKSNSIAGLIAELSKAAVVKKAE